MTWQIKEFTISEQEARRQNLNNRTGRYVPAGTWRKLIDPTGLIIMTDTPDELRDLREFRHRASGRVLINGLGLGIAVKMALEKDDVTHVDVVEIEPQVVDLVEPLLYSDITYSSERLDIWIADAFTWKPPARNTRWNVVWHDIWPTICSDNLSEMERLHRRYGGRSDWQGSWCWQQCRRAAKFRLF